MVNLISIVAVSMISAKFATLDLLKLKVFWNKGYDVIISVHDVTSKMLAHVSYYIVAVIMWPKFGNPNISTREVIITSILYGFDQKNQFFEGCSWFKLFNDLGLAIRMTLKFFILPYPYWIGLRVSYSELY